jgi:cell wall-associated NlpC family hydrolase
MSAWRRGSLIKRVLIAALSILTITLGIAAPDKKARRTSTKKVAVSRTASSHSTAKRSKSTSSTKKSTRKESSPKVAKSKKSTSNVTKTTAAPVAKVARYRSREIGRGRMIGQNVNIRSAPSSDSNLLTKVSGGEVAIVAQKGDWLKLRFQYGTEGWVRQDFVQVYQGRVAQKATPSAKPTVTAKKPEATVAKAEPKKSNTFVDPVEPDPASAPAVTRDPEPTAVPVKAVTNVEEKRYVSLIGESINVRRGPSTSNSVVTKVKGGKAEVLDKWGDWYKLKFQYGTVGWVRNDFLNLPGVERPTREKSETVIASAPDTDKSENVIQAAKNMRGTRYVWGGISSRGTDCSGFTLQIFRKNGISLPRTAREQVHCGVPVKRADLQPGDLIFFKAKSYVSHVGISLGGNRFIHASSGGRKVMESTLSGWYSSKYYSARRVIKSGTKLTFPKAGSDLGELDSTPQAAPGTDIVND